MESALHNIDEKSDTVFKIGDGLYIVCNNEWAEMVWDCVKPYPPNKSLGILNTKEFFNKMAASVTGR